MTERLWALRTHGTPGLAEQGVFAIHQCWQCRLHLETIFLLYWVTLNTKIISPFSPHSSVWLQERLHYMPGSLFPLACPCVVIFKVCLDPHRLPSLASCAREAWRMLSSASTRREGG